MGTRGTEIEKLVLKMVTLWSQEEEPEHKTGYKEGSIKGSSKAGGKVFLGKGVWGAVQQREQG